MSSDNVISNVDPEDVSTGQLLEWYRGAIARIEQLEKENDQLREDLERFNSNSVTKSAMNQIIAALLDDRSEVDFAADPVENAKELRDQSAEREAELAMLKENIAEAEQ